MTRLYVVKDAEYGDFPGGAQLYSVSQDGGRPQRVTSLPIKSMSVNKDGKVIYEDYKGYEDPFRKHHTSSVTRDIWLYTPTAGQKGFGINADGTFTKISDFIGEDRNPVFAPDGNTYYYLSEKDGTYNIYKSSIDAPAESTQITFHKDNPARYLSISANGVICYSQDGELYIIKNSQQPQKVNISIITDQIENSVEYQNLTSGATRLAISPNGKEVAITARGDVYITSVDHRTTRRITNTPEQERGITFSKDGRTIYYAAERNGHWGIWETSLTDKDDKYFTYSVKMEEKPVTKAGETCFQPQVAAEGDHGQDHVVVAAVHREVGLAAQARDLGEICRRFLDCTDIRQGRERLILFQRQVYARARGDIVQDHGAIARRLGNALEMLHDAACRALVAVGRDHEQGIRPERHGIVAERAGGRRVGTAAADDHGHTSVCRILGTHGQPPPLGACERRRFARCTRYAEGVDAHIYLPFHQTAESIQIHLTARKRRCQCCRHARKGRFFQNVCLHKNLHLPQSGITNSYNEILGTALRAAKMRLQLSA